MGFAMVVLQMAFVAVAGIVAVVAMILVAVAMANLSLLAGMAIHLVGRVIALAVVVGIVSLPRFSNEMK